MKFVKRISLFLVYPMIMFLVGLYCGVASNHFFYPGNNIVENSDLSIMLSEQDRTENSIQAPAKPDLNTPEVVETVQKEATLTKDTVYVLQEIDVAGGTSHEFIYSLPEKYIGMNRELFVGAMDAYEISPPLKEIERGFYGLEVLSFSAERVVVEMSYLFVEPTNNFYLCVEGNYIVVYLDDKETLYMSTDILLENLPENIQSQIISYMYIKGEEELYHFLESYSS